MILSLNLLKCFFNKKVAIRRTDVCKFAFLIFKIKWFLGVNHILCRIGQWLYLFIFYLTLINWKKTWNIERHIGFLLKRFVFQPGFHVIHFIRWKTCQSSKYSYLIGRAQAALLPLLFSPPSPPCLPEPSRLLRFGSRCQNDGPASFSAQ